MDIKKILGDSCTDEIAANLQAEIEKEYVAKTDHEALQNQLAERDRQLGELSKTDPGKLQEEIARLQNENAASAEKHAADIAALKLSSAIESRLLKEGAVNTKAVKALLDCEKISLGEDGSITGLDEQLDAIRQSDSWAFASPGVPGAGANPAAKQADTVPGKPEIDKIFNV